MVHGARTGRCLVDSYNCRAWWLRALSGWHLDYFARGVQGLLCGVGQVPGQPEALVTPVHCNVLKQQSSPAKAASSLSLKYKIKVHRLNET